MVLLRRTDGEGWTCDESSWQHQVPAFSTRYREFAQMRAFPEWAKVYETLGIGSGAERLVFDANAGGAAIREAIMAPRPALPAAAKAEAGSP